MSFLKQEQELPWAKLCQNAFVAYYKFYIRSRNRRDRERMKRPSRSLSLLSFPPRVAVWTAKPRARVLRKKLHVAEGEVLSCSWGCKSDLKLYV